MSRVILHFTSVLEGNLYHFAETILANMKPVLRDGPDGEMMSNLYPYNYILCRTIQTKS
jgi:hypothetical protein